MSQPSSARNLRASCGCQLGGSAPADDERPEVQNKGGPKPDDEDEEDENAEEEEGQEQEDDDNEEEDDEVDEEEDEEKEEKEDEVEDEERTRRRTRTRTSKYVPEQVLSVHVLAPLLALHQSSPI